MSATGQTVLGDVRVRRAADRCPSGGVPALPRDDQLGVPTDRTSPLLRARVSRFGGVVPFAGAGTLWEEASRVQVSAKRAQLVSEELGTRLEAHQAAPAVSEEGREEGRTPRRIYGGMDGVFSCPTERDAPQALLWREATVGVIALP